MEAQLRARIETIVSTLRHPIRGIEHRTFKRLLYRNRNQHRHGLYFRKLEHVRRLLSHIDRHVAWESLKYSLGDDNNKGSKAKANLPLSISSLTVDDLKSVESLFDKLVNKAIIEAARRVVIDLVSREHFLPFAVSILATLARLFVIERNLLSEVRGITTEMNVLFATNGPSKQSKEHMEYNLASSKDEDIGLEVIDSTKPQPKLQCEAEASEVGSDHVDLSSNRKADFMKRELPQSTGVQASTSEEPGVGEPSLYHLVAKHVNTAKFSVEVRARTSVTLPEVMWTKSGLERPSHSSGDRTVRPRETTPARSTPPMPLQPTDEHPGDSVPGTSTQQTGFGARLRRKFEREGAVNASDSDDIDDIFDALDDT